MQAKPTFYNGVIYDSALEAKYAESFDFLGIAFESKPYWFRGNGVKYNPDFRLMGNGPFFEVKGYKFEKTEQLKLDLVVHQGERIFMGDSNGFLYEAKKGELRRAALVKCLSCLRWYISDCCDAEKEGHIRVRGCAYGCENSRKIVRDNIFDAVGEQVFVRERQWPLGSYAID